MILGLGWCTQFKTRCPATLPRDLKEKTKMAFWPLSMHPPPLHTDTHTHTKESIFSSLCREWKGIRAYDKWGRLSKFLQSAYNFRKCWVYLLLKPCSSRNPSVLCCHFIQKKRVFDGEVKSFYLFFGSADSCSACFCPPDRSEVQMRTRLARI